MMVGLKEVKSYVLVCRCMLTVSIVVMVLLDGSTDVERREQGGRPVPPLRTPNRTHLLVATELLLAVTELRVDRQTQRRRLCVVAWPAVRC